MYIITKWTLILKIKLALVVHYFLQIQTCKKIVAMVTHICKYTRNQWNVVYMGELYMNYIPIKLVPKNGLCKTLSGGLPSGPHPCWYAITREPHIYLHAHPAVSEHSPSNSSHHFSALQSFPLYPLQWGSIHQYHHPALWNYPLMPWSSRNLALPSALLTLQPSQVSSIFAHSSHHWTDQLLHPDDSPSHLPETCSSYCPGIAPSLLRSSAGLWSLALYPEAIPKLTAALRYSCCIS